MFKNKKLLITGDTDSFGNAVLRIVSREHSIKIIDTHHGEIKI